MLPIVLKSLLSECSVETDWFSKLKNCQSKGYCGKYSLRKSDQQVWNFKEDQSYWQVNMAEIPSSLGKIAQSPPTPTPTPFCIFCLTVKRESIPD